MDQSELYALYEGDPEPIVGFLRYVADAYDLPDPPTVLDLGCGPGRMLPPLHELGWTVVGYEPDPEYAAAAARAATSLPNARAREAGFEALDDAEAFDMIAAINAPFTYLLTFAARRDALARCREALRPGGVLVLDQSNPLWILKNYREPPELVIDVNGVSVRRTAVHRFDFHDGTLTHTDTFRWEELGQTRELTKSHRMALVAFPEIAGLLELTGYTDVRTFGGYDSRSPQRLEGKRMIVTARVGTPA